MLLILACISASAFACACVVFLCGGFVMYPKRYVGNVVKAAHLNKQKDLQAVAQPPQVERKQKEPDKPPKKLKQTVKTVGFIPYDKIGGFAKKF